MKKLAYFVFSIFMGIKMRVGWLLSLVFAFSSLLLSAQGGNGSALFATLSQQPDIVHFGKSEYNSDSEFWSAARDTTGVLYFGNNDGILIYDGEQWQPVKLPNGSSVRSLLCTSQNVVYAGGYNEFGRVQKDSLGGYYFKSLLSQFNLEGKELENMEQAHELDGSVVFRFYKELMVIENGFMTQIPSSKDFMYGNVVDKTYYVQDKGVGVLAYSPKDHKLSTTFSYKDFDDETIKGLYAADTPYELLVFTESGRLFRANLATHKMVFVKNIFAGSGPEQVTSSQLKDKKIFVGTLGSGVRIFRTDGSEEQAPLVFDNLQNPSIINMLSTPQGLWLLLNNGLDFVNYGTGANRFFPESKIYDINIGNHKLYVATNKGVYWAGMDQKEPILQRMDALQGQSWTLKQWGGDLFVGHHRGLFCIKDDKVVPITNFGVWKMMGIPGSSTKFLACGYTGLYLVEKVNGNFVLRNKIKGFEESTRDIIPADEPDTYWVCHGYKGVFRIKVDPEYQRVYSIDHFTDKNGFKSPFNINAFQWNGKVVFTSNNGIYTYNIGSNRFEPYAPLNKILDTTKNTRKILQEGPRTWVVQDDEVGYFDSGMDTLVKRPFLSSKGQLNRGMESIVPLDKNKVLVGSTDGIFMFKMTPPKAIKSTTHITQVAFSKNNHFTALPIDDVETEVPKHSDLIQFHFADPKLAMNGPLQYQYVLEGVNMDWSNWGADTAKEYAHLRPGSYVFKVRSRDMMGNVGKVASYPFYVQAAWCQTNAATILFILIVIGLLWGAYVLVRRSIEKKNHKAHVEHLKAKKLLTLEIERLKLKHDKEKIEQDKIHLEEDVLAKSKELANYTMQLVNKSDIFNEMQADLKELREVARSQASRQKITEIFRKLHQHRIGEEYMEVFDVNFEKVHHQFFEKLKVLEPKLSKKDQRLCAFIKMDLTNKEISPLLNISVRGVETARYRVRKKLHVEHDSNFQEFLSNL